MNLNNAAALVRNDITTVKIDLGKVGPEFQSKVYTYKVLRDLARTLEPGDYVVLEKEDGVRIGRVHSVDPEPDIDPDATFTYRWCVQQVDLAALDRLRQEDESLAERVRSVQRDNYRRQILDSLNLTEMDVTEALQCARST